MAEPSTVRLPILLYHVVDEVETGELRRFAVSPAEFERQLAYLAGEGYRSVTLEEWSSAARRGRSLPGRVTVLTFDDGYRDFFDTAWPLLRAYGFGALVFLVAKRVGAANLWTGPLDERPLMGWQEIRTLADEGVQFGSHTLTHPRLTSLTPEELARELADSRLALEDELALTVTTIAYPWGDHDATVQSAAWAAGFEYGLTTDEGFAAPEGKPLALPRIEIFASDTLDDFARKLSAQRSE